MDSSSDKDNLCILCCSNANNTMILPCKHLCCDECLRMYLSDKNTCFLCKGKIEGHELVKLK